MGLTKDLGALPRVLTVSGSNIGVGTATPTSKLTVNGQITLGDPSTYQSTLYDVTGVNLISSNPANGLLTVGDSFIVRDVISSTVAFKGGGSSEVMRFSSSGNVGIGTTSPSARLSVTDTSNSTTAVFSGASGGVYSTFNITTLGANGNGYWRGSAIGGNIKMVSNQPAVNVNGFSASAIAFGSDANQGRIGFFTTTSNTGDTVLTEAMRVDTGGNVGIGLTNPDTLLHVYGTAGWIKAETNSNNSARFQAKNSSQTTDFGTDSNGGFIQTQGAYPILVYTNQTERMRITSGGSLLIGATSQGFNPATQGYLLGVKSSVGQAFISIAKSGQTLDSGGMIVGLDASTGYVYLRENIALTFGTNDTERMKLTAGGDLLIGASSTSGLARSATLDSSSNCGIVLKTSGTNKGYLYTSVDNLYLETTGGNVVARALTGGAYLSNGATSWASASDRRLKDINYKIENAVDKLCTLDAVSFSWKSDESKKEVLGLIAQDVQKVFPQIIDKSKLPKSIGDESEVDETEYLGVRYQELIPVLVKAIQELTERIKTLENK